MGGGGGVMWSSLCRCLLSLCHFRSDPNDPTAFTQLLYIILWYNTVQFRQAPSRQIVWQIFAVTFFCEWSQNINFREDSRTVKSNHYPSNSQNAATNLIDPKVRYDFFVIPYHCHQIHFLIILYTLINYLQQLSRWLNP
jgi:hypothetical protein